MAALPKAILSSQKPCSPAKVLVAKQTGGPVFGATLNKAGSFRFEVTNVGFGTMLSQIVPLVENTQASRPPLSGWADQVSTIFVPPVVIFILTLVLWFDLAPLDTRLPLPLALVNCVAVLISACPCAPCLASHARRLDSLIWAGNYASKRSGFVKSNGRSGCYSCSLNLHYVYVPFPVTLACAGLGWAVFFVLHEKP